MCTKNLWNPTGPCCGENVHCNKFPKLDWSKWSWKVTTPDAEMLQQETVEVTRSGMLNGNTWNYVSSAITGTTTHPSEADVGTGYPIFTDTLFGPFGFWYRGGTYLTRHNGSCVWQIYNRERLVHMNVCSLEIDKLINGTNYIWFIGVRYLLSQEQLTYWQSKIVRTPEIIQTIEGFPYYGWGGTTFLNTEFVSLRDVLPRYECVWKPIWEGRSDLSDIRGTGPFEFLSVLDAFRNGSWSNVDYLYKPTAIELAAASSLTPGFLFGFVSDQRSPLYGQFTCFEGAVQSQGDGDGVDPVIQEVPWTLVSGDEVRAEAGVVNRFERTNADQSLPAWIELELVRI